MNELEELGIRLNINEPEHVPNMQYRAQKSQGAFGVSDDNKLHTGLTLERIEQEGDNGCDIIDEEISNIGAEANIILPDGGLIEGHIYEAVAVNIKRDWETSCVDDWDVQILDVTDSDGGDSEEHF